MTEGRRDGSQAMPEVTADPRERDRTGPEEAAVKQEHIAETLEVLRVPPDYARFFRRWKAALRVLPGTLFARAEVRGRLVVGLGAESVLETSITLHRTYGVPYLPGSALKGLAAAAAHRHLEDPRWRKAVSGQPLGESHRLLFGDQDWGGVVTFHDALWIAVGERLPLDLDVLTVHHPGYYGTGQQPPADWDSPIPVPFVTSRGAFQLAVTGPEAWADAALSILSEALATDGLGAKTAAGYGRLKVQREEPPQAPRWEEMVRGLNLGSAGRIVPDVLGLLADHPAERRRAAQRMIERLGGKKSIKPHRDKSWAKALLAAAGS